MLPEVLPDPLILLALVHSAALDAGVTHRRSGVIPSFGEGCPLPGGASRDCYSPAGRFTPRGVARPVVRVRGEPGRAFLHVEGRTTCRTARGAVASCRWPTPAARAASPGAPAPGPPSRAGARARVGPRQPPARARARSSPRARPTGPPGDTRRTRRPGRASRRPTYASGPRDSARRPEPR